MIDLGTAMGQHRCSKCKKVLERLVPELFCQALNSGKRCASKRPSKNRSTPTPTSLSLTNCQECGRVWSENCYCAICLWAERLTTGNGAVGSLPVSDTLGADCAGHLFALWSPEELYLSYRKTSQKKKKKQPNKKNQS